MDPESRHRECWDGRRTPHIPQDLGVQTIEDGQLLYCAHPMLFPVVGHRFDVRNCERCECFRSRVAPRPSRSDMPGGLTR
jgi:hypothetical protein